ncbi:hypothetical protein HETIRDRAFT_386743 [Heterobasidion irregulare TC 32-1]|uniref:Uncharacterized protein n=1 Tax=Heterobasidion irregulare (strain TC 32-1) TaxID=747525 RepID=W4JYG7_HETIT|nr:uncharacterized protein HETIRDRAFT_386743 [Heterobasidion irregulare TC 32-1]ETW78588.1 hypothetical protein HETIRDRAFT_386743 [Heterobasidion irregulare TC 32-1]
MATTAHAPSGYSSIFASGLLATPRPHRHTDSGSSPMAEDLESTPTGLKSHISEYPPSPTPSYITEMESEHSRSRASSTASVSSFTAPPPRLRRRRSSLTVGTSVMGNIKSPLRSAGNALQRTVLMSPTGGSRSRSGSLSVDVDNMPQPMSASLNGRMRSGSVGDALRSRRAIRKPAAAPPSMPLPPPPMPLFVPASAPPTDQSFRRPLHRSHTADNNCQHFGAYLTSDFANKLIVAMKTPPGSAGTSPVDGGFWVNASVKEN